MDFRKNHRGAYLSLSALILSVLLVLTLLQGCGETNDPERLGTYHTVTKNSQTWYVLDKEYTGDYDLQKVVFWSEPVTDNMDGDLLIPVENAFEVPGDFNKETVFDRAGYEAYCETWGLTPAFPKHDGGFAVIAYGSQGSVRSEIQLGGVTVADNTVTVLIRDRFSELWDNSAGFVLTLPVPADVTEIEILPLYTEEEVKNLHLAEITYDKPVIYLYPERETPVTVKLDCDGALTCAYPAYGDGWTVTAAPDGTLTDAEGQTYSYLYWEGAGEGAWDFSRGFCVRGADTAAFLEDALAELGLTRREANEFIIYWLPLMEDNPWNLISFQNEAYTDRARLTVDPTPDTVIRVFMAWEALEAPIDIEPQILTAPERSGFVLVEWGGAEK